MRTCGNRRKAIKRAKTAKTAVKIKFLFMTGFILSIIVYSVTIFCIVQLLEYFGISINRFQNPTFAIIAICIFGIIASTIGSILIINKVLTPINNISKAAKKIAKGNFDVQIDYNGKIEELENVIQNFNYMAKELNSVEMIRNDFIANVSHEFKTPLSSIKGYVTLLQDSGLTEEERSEYFQKTFFNIEKLNNLTDNILRISKIENSACLDAPVTYRLDEQIREAIVVLEPKWSEKQIEFELDLPETVYFGQKSLLFQVWLNLISNAVKFSDKKGYVSICLKKEEELFSVYISDNGIGMDNDTMEHIFEKFYQGDTSRQTQGNGLGLALCKEILDRCGGKIFVTSEPEKGSVFMVKLN